MRQKPVPQAAFWKATAFNISFCFCPPGEECANCTCSSGVESALEEELGGGGGNGAATFTFYLALTFSVGVLSCSQLAGWLPASASVQLSWESFDWVVQICVSMEEWDLEIFLVLTFMFDFTFFLRKSNFHCMHLLSIFYPFLLIFSGAFISSHKCTGIFRTINSSRLIRWSLPKATPHF